MGQTGSAYMDALHIVAIKKDCRTDYPYHINDRFLTEHWEHFDERAIQHLSENFKYYNISEEFLSNRKDEHWDWNVLSCTVSLDFIDKNPDIKWNWDFVLNREDITEEFQKKYADKPYKSEYSESKRKRLN